MFASSDMAPVVRAWACDFELVEVPNGSYLAIAIEGVHGIEKASGCGCGGVPRSLARDGVGVEATTARGGKRAHLRDVAASMSQGDLVLGRVAPLAMVERAEQFNVLAQRPRNRPQASDVLRMIPPVVVTAAVGVRDEGDGLQRTGRRRRWVRR